MKLTDINCTLVHEADVCQMCSRPEFASEILRRKASGVYQIKLTNSQDSLTHCSLLAPCMKTRVFMFKTVKRWATNMAGVGEITPEYFQSFWDEHKDSQLSPTMFYQQVLSKRQV